MGGDDIGRIKPPSTFSGACNFTSRRLVSSKVKMVKITKNFAASGGKKQKISPPPAVKNKKFRRLRRFF